MGFLKRIIVPLLLGLVLAALPASGQAALVEGLYDGVVPGDASEAGRPAAASDALRQVVVRLTGRRAAATDPQLTALYADARRLAQTFRSAPGGQVLVGFDREALDAALARAGQRLWSAERPATLIAFVSSKPGAPHTLAGAEPDLKREVVATAQQRGLPLVWPTGIAPAVEQDRVEDALAGRLEPLRDFARQYGADGVLVGKSGPAGITWSWLGPAGSGTTGGSGADAVQALADRYGAQLAAVGVEKGQVVAVVRGVRDLAGYAAAGSALAALATVRAVALEEANGETLRFRLAFDGDPEALRQAVRDSARLMPDESVPSGGALQLVLRP